MTSVPIDVFNREESTTVDSILVRAFLYADRFSYSAPPPEGVINPFGFAYNGSSNFYRELWGRQFPSSEWMLRSRGPSGTGNSSDLANLGDSVDKRDAYDPTNGTVSRGNIFLLGPGIGFLDDGK